MSLDFFFFLMGQQKWKDKRQEGVPYFGAVMRETTIPRLRVGLGLVYLNE